MSANLKLSHVIEFVADMDAAVKFYRDVIGLPLKFQSPGWSEFVTGETSFALHPASESKTAGSVELGFQVDDLGKFHQEMSAKGIKFSMPPTKQEYGRMLAQFVDSEGAHSSVSAAM
ncbi:MAG: VOC family protein [Candidatus Acidiferrales bacterium]